MRKQNLILIFILTLMPTLSGCGIIDYFYLPPGEDTAQELFEAGNDAMREKNYVAAASYYSKLKEDHPFSPNALAAELALADAYFLDEEWAAAVETYKDFENMHPRHEAIPYVLHKIGIANMKLYPSIDRATQPVQDAYSYFQRLVETYPDTEYAKDAANKMVEARAMLAKHELYVGDFYFRMGQYASALSRYREVETNYRDVPEAYDYAVNQSKIAFIKHREKRSSQKQEKREGSWKEMFDWL
ncbi:outer membrane protein assembly factor BamD [Desulfovibrio litoralis]|uniref:Beta-barrel assembly machine subunit BamD n=1 Tax=Desulfovibrio litoralis DSM 11393 TaxID=1121455 RepID=A0A1M7SRR0_9BACT|nr:outer membrane protein assembly factor BamD [Desulfovibrio litoralis]SHN61084.1 Beta-barrel assembly machine subunit BamD [Desulfovibrio litoralis DSM 11393]